MFLTPSKHPRVCAPVLKPLYSLPFLQIVDPLPNKELPILVLKSSLSIRLIVLYLALVSASIRIIQRSISLCLAISPLTNILCAVRECLGPITVLLPRTSIQCPFV